MKQISIIGATFYGNRGAEAMLTTSISELQSLNKKDLIFNVYSYYPKMDRSLCKKKNIFIYSSTPFYLVSVLAPLAILYRIFTLLKLDFFKSFFPASIQSLANSSALICLAGVSFIDGREKFLPFNMATIFPAIILGVPVVKFSQAMGPFNKPVNKITAKIFLKNCNRVFARGGITQQNLKNTFPNDSFYQRANDIAFLYKPEYSLITEEVNIDEKLKVIENIKKDGDILIGLCPSVVVAKQRESLGANYAQEISDFIKVISAPKRKIILFPNATRGNDLNKTHNNDLPLLMEIANKLDSTLLKNISVFDFPINASQVHRIINNCDIVVTSRFHAMIGALACSKPVMVLGWSHKYIEVMELFNQQDMVIDFAQLDNEAMSFMFEKLMNEADNRSSDIAKKLPSVQEISKIQIEHINNLLSSQ